MGKTSCLRIISCGGRFVESNEAGPADQTNHPKVKKGWSFKKKSSSGRAVTNSVIAKTPSPEHKQNIQSASSDSIVTEKECDLQWDKKSPPPQVAADLCVPDTIEVNKHEKQATTTMPDSCAAVDVSTPNTEKQSDTADLCVTDGLTDPKTVEYDSVIAVHETDVVIIQSAVRGFLARKELTSIVRLQAMVRGHLVRCHAAGALRCVQAIAKMQVLVRARYARTRKISTPPKSKPEITYTSMTDLLKSSFARQLLESSPKSKPIKIKCDPLSRDSSWVWLERWMSLASPGAVDNLNAEDEIVQEVKNIGTELEEKTIDKDQEEKIIVDDYLFNEENEIFLDAKDFSNPSLGREDSNLDVTEDTKLTNGGEMTSNNFIMDSHAASLVGSQRPDILEVGTVESSTAMDSVNHTSSEYSDRKIGFFVDEKPQSKTEQAVELEIEVTEQRKELMEELKTEVEVEEVVQPQTEDENVVPGSQEEPNSLLATESKLVSPQLSADLSEVFHDARVEEPISASHLAVVNNGSIPLKGEVEEEQASFPQSAFDSNSAYQNAETEEVMLPHSSEHDFNEETAASSEDDIVINHREPSQLDHSNIQVGESECGTELSITSTLDSPDRMEIEPNKIELEKVVSADSEFHESKFSRVGDEFETESGSVEKKEVDINVSTLQLQSEAGGEETKTNVSGLHTETEGDAEKSHQASPGSQVTFSESQGTPSSQASVSTKSKTAKSGSIKKRTILSVAKKSPSTNSGGKVSSEQQLEEQKSAKRRTSFGSPKPEVSDQEHRRDSSTSSSLPSYMQPTESARAKANAAGHSPHSSPDLADNNVFLKKRHSLSGAKDKQDSPRLRRTSSQAQPGSKSNGTSPLERKWQR